MSALKVVRGLVLLLMVGGNAAAAPKDLPHCNFLTKLAEMDLLWAEHNNESERVARHFRISATAHELREELRSPKVAPAFLPQELIQIDAYLAEQGKAASPDQRHVRPEQRLPWRDQAFAQKLALCDAVGDNPAPILVGNGTGNRDGVAGHFSLSTAPQFPTALKVQKAGLALFFILVLCTTCLWLGMREPRKGERRRSERIYCYVPVSYSTGNQLRRGWILDLSSEGCKLKTEGESLKRGVSLRISTNTCVLRGQVAWISLNYAGIDLHEFLDASHVKQIALENTQTPARP